MSISKMARQVEKIRKTNETEIKVKMNLDGNGVGTIQTPIRFLITCLNKLF
ncbi:MAG: hypothetical protein L6V95_06800 [Candidatus Melainabacteria bacterium]|nr:MAG: hypothetical protein L6V95_06800 [Candidatus Melainabacteria bacterium]